MRVSPLWLLAVPLAFACSSSATRPDGGTVCTQGPTTLCPAGTQCTNGDCVPTCDASGNCAAGFYCESDAGPLNVCSPITSVECNVDTDCPDPQACSAGGICFSTEYRANGTQQGCLLFQGAQDGCSDDALCYQIPTTSGSYQNQCVGLQHCGLDGGCPIGAGGSGAVCNQLPDGGYIFDGKERLCLYDFCLDQSHCPSGTVCFHATPGDPLGQCQLGESPDECYTNSDCPNAYVGCELADGGVDDGGTLGVCY